jgi:transcriptional regulator with XRE-family HTH domain
VDSDKEQGRRLSLLRKHLGLTQVNLAKQLNISQTFISATEIGNSGISATMLEGIASLYPHVNLHWLLLGVGTMLNTTIVNNYAVSEPVGEYGKASIYDMPDGKAILTSRHGRYMSAPRLAKITAPPTSSYLCLFGRKSRR